MSRRLVCFVCFVCAVLVAGCGKTLNPAICCVSEADCDVLGVDDGPHPCEEPGQICKEHACVAFECLSNTDCDAATPICVENVCVEACATNDDCSSSASHPYCADTGECVACASNAHCSSASPYCDGETHECRGCELDVECGVGACVEATGACFTDGQMVFVSDAGTDAGDCARSAPCRSITFAQGLVTQMRPVIKLLGSQYSGDASTVNLSTQVDGSNTNLVGPHPLFRVSTAASLSSVRLASTSFDDTLVSVVAGGALKLGAVTLDRAEIRVTTGALEVVKARVIDGRIACTQGTATVRESEFERSSAHADNCMLTLQSNRFRPKGGSGGLVFGNGLLKIENNLFLENVTGRSQLLIFGYDIGSTVRFNTFVNEAAVSSTASMVCPAGLDVTSNIFAVNSTMPLNECTARNSLFDAAGASAVAGGPMNKSEESTFFFVNTASADFHLSSGSPANQMGEPGLVTTDIEGTPRAAMPDVGAFERP